MLDIFGADPVAWEHVMLTMVTGMVTVATSYLSYLRWHDSQRITELEEKLKAGVERETALRHQLYAVEEAHSRCADEAREFRTQIGILTAKIEFLTSGSVYWKPPATTTSTTLPPAKP